MNSITIRKESLGFFLHIIMWSKSENANQMQNPMTKVHPNLKNHSLSILATILSIAILCKPSFLLVPLASHCKLHPIVGLLHDLIM